MRRQFCCSRIRVWFRGEEKRNGKNSSYYRSDKGLQSGEAGKYYVDGRHVRKSGEADGFDVT